MVDAGFEAVATTSAGVAASLGFGDGERTPADEMFAAIARISSHVDVPVTADVEAGYGLGPSELAQRLVDAGAVGCNLEDTDHETGLLRSPDDQARRIADLVEAVHRLGVPVLVNARVDVFVRASGDEGERVELALERARAYRDAGAGCVYPILASEGELASFADRYDGPVNAMAVGGRVRLSRLAASGVARISFGSQLQRGTQAWLGRSLEAITRSDDLWPDA